MQNRPFLLTTLALATLGGALIVAAAAPQAPVPPPTVPQFKPLTVRIMIEPAEAVAAGGEFKKTTQSDWHQSGDTVTWEPVPAHAGPDGRMVPPLPCRIQLKPLDAWDEGTVHECRSPVVYRPASGTVSIIIKPDELARGDVRWAIDSMDAPWTRSGEEMRSVVGTYKLLFKGFDEGEWQAPANQEVKATKNTTTRRTITFTRK